MNEKDVTSTEKAMDKYRNIRPHPTGATGWELWYNTRQKMSVYLDNCCYNRPFDDQTQVKVFIETLAKLSIQQQMRDGVVEYVWSEVLDFDIFDYTEWRKDNLFPNETVDSLYDKINAYSAVKGELRSAMVQETVW